MFLLFNGVISSKHAGGGVQFVDAVYRYIVCNVPPLDNTPSENTLAMESYLTLMFGVIGYAEIAFSILPGALIDLFARYADRQWGILSCQAIAALLCAVLSILMGLRSQLAAVIAITCYYMFRTFTFGSLSVFAAVCFPVRASLCGCHVSRREVQDQSTLT